MSVANARASPTLSARARARRSTCAHTRGCAAAAACRTSCEHWRTRASGEAHAHASLNAPATRDAGASQLLDAPMAKPNDDAAACPIYTRAPPPPLSLSRVVCERARALSLSNVHVAHCEAPPTHAERRRSARYARARACEAPRAQQAARCISAWSARNYISAYSHAHSGNRHACTRIVCATRQILLFIKKVVSARVVDDARTVHAERRLAKSGVERRRY